MFDFALDPRNLRLMAGAGVLALLTAALLAPMATLLAMPLLLVLLAALFLYEFPLALVGLLILAFGLGLDIQVEMLRSAGGGAGQAAAVLGTVVVKVVPYALTVVLVLRYGFSKSINWPFLAYTALAGLSIAVLPMGRVITNADMLRSYFGSVAPFVIGLALAPNSLWTALCRGIAFVPLISAVLGIVTAVIGFYPTLDEAGRFQGLMSPPFLAGYCTTAIFAATLEYLRGFRLRWIIVAGANLVVLLATQARAPLIAVLIFFAIVFLLSNRHTFPLRRKVDLVMGGTLPGMLVLGPAALYAAQRFFAPDYSGKEFGMSGRDVIWPFFLDAIERRPLFGYGLGAGKMIVNPDDQLIKYLGSNAAHNEYLRLSVDGGIIGCAAIFASIAAWVVFGTRHLAPTERLVLQAAILSVLVHAGFDNLLIASPAVIQFGWFAAAMARARQEAKFPTVTRRDARRSALSRI